MAYDTLHKRDWKIYFEWLEGKNYDVLSEEFKLATSTIKEICTSHVPPKIRQQSWQTANQYAKWREYCRKNKRNS